jgi:hypothetical protein
MSIFGNGSRAGMGTDPLNTRVYLGQIRERLEDAVEGGNITDMSIFSSDLEAKRLELLNESVSRGTIGYLLDPNFEAASQQRQAVELVGQATLRSSVAHLCKN